MSQRRRRRVLLLSPLFGLALAAGLAIRWPGAKTQVSATGAGRLLNRDPQTTADRRQADFTRYLARLKAAVDQQRRADSQAGAFAGDLRTAAIGRLGQCEIPARDRRSGACEVQAPQEWQERRLHPDPRSRRI